MALPILLSAAFCVLIIAMTLMCGAHDREIDELRHRVTMLEMQKEGDGR